MAISPREDDELLGEGLDDLFDVTTREFAEACEGSILEPTDLIRGAADGVVLFDCRRPHEQAVATIPGARSCTEEDVDALVAALRDVTARHAAGDVPGQVDGEDSRRTASPVAAIYCTAGGRASNLVSRLPDDLRERVALLRGGIIAYANAGGSLVEPATGRAVRRLHPYSGYWARFVKPPTEIVLT